MSFLKINKTHIFVGSLFFGLMFGAGNLIFPVFLGQQAGGNVAPSSIAFIITAAGLPFLAVMAFAISKTNSLHELASKVGTKYATVLTVLLYLTIGPLFAMPRTGTVAFEVSFGAFVTADNRALMQLIFTVLFFGVAFIFALKPSKILVWVGKVLNPIFLFFMAFLILNVLLNPMATQPGATVLQEYIDMPFMKGFVEGYQTMDVLAALAFGSIIIKTIYDLNIKETKDVAITAIKSGVICLIGMCIIYGSLAWIGATSTMIMPVAENGGIALANVSAHYFGAFGSVFLAIVVTVACLKTAIGLITACSETFQELLPFKVSYATYVVIFTSVCTLIANVGLAQLIQLSLPVLMFLYPLCITLIILGMCAPLIKDRRAIYIGATIGAGVLGVIDGIAAAPAFIQSLPGISAIIVFAQQYIPLFSMGMGWLIPMFVGAVIGILIEWYRARV